MTILVAMNQHNPPTNINTAMTVPFVGFLKVPKNQIRPIQNRIDEARIWDLRILLGSMVLLPLS
jgi:hypothetical protein